MKNSTISHQRPLALLQMVGVFIVLALGSPLSAGEASLAKEIALLKGKDEFLQAAINEHLGVVHHLASTKRFLQTAKAGTPQDAVAQFMHANPVLFGGDDSLLQTGKIARQTTSPHSGLQTMVWKQHLFDIPVHNALLNAHLGKNNELLSIGSAFLPAADAAAVVDTSATARSAADALSAALNDKGESQQLTPDDGVKRKHTRNHPAAKGTVYANLTWYVKTTKDVPLAWSLTGVDRKDDIMYEWLVDAHSLAVLDKIRLTSYGLYNQNRAQQIFNKQAIAAANAKLAAPTASSTTSDNAIAQAGATIRLNVYTSESPRPLSPGWPTNSGSQPPEVPRTLVELTAIDDEASPNGWINGSLQTIGNNVDAHLDLDDDNNPDLPRPQGSGTPTTFNFPLDLSQSPTTYRNAAVTNLFYWCNFAHDRFYQLGFTESAGNFQTDNFGKGGSGGDALLADAQDGGGTNNANMSTPTDGTPPRMQMYIFTLTSPNRDGDLDASVMIHEFVHGVSNRLVGGGASGSLNASQSGGMGEGWSDFFAMTLTSEPDDALYGTYTTGSYLVGNYYNGIRRYPYSAEPNPIVTASSKNPLTYADIISNPEVHDAGEVWCIALWECRAELIKRHGAETGNTMIMELVMDGMKLTPSQPTFVQARDGILQADLNANGGANQDILWRAFAKRGLGRGAYGGSSADDNAGVIESFEAPSHLSVNLAQGIVGGGDPGGPLTLSTSSFIIKNVGDASLNYTVTDQRSWFSFSPSSGTLAPNASQTITVTTTGALSLPEGDFSEYILFSDTTNNETTLRSVLLSIHTNYTKSTETYSWVDPTSHTKLTLGDDDVSDVLALPFTFNFYGQDYSSFRIDSNGLIKLGSQDDVSYPANQSMPKAGQPNAIIAPWWDDLYPGGVSGRVRYGVVGTAPNRRVVITWLGVPHYYDFSDTSPFTFQAIIEEDTDDIVFQYKEVQTGFANYGRGRSATIGVEDALGVIARVHSYNGSTLLNNSSAFRFHRTITPPSSNNAPTIAAAISVSSPITAMSTVATVLGADDGGEANLTYNWSLGGKLSTAATFSPNGTNAAKSTTITFTGVGTYPLQVAIVDAEGKSVIATTNVVVLPSPESIVVSPDGVTIPNLTTQQFSATRYDGFGNAMDDVFSPTWSMVSGPGSINSSGLYTANGRGDVTVQADDNGRIDTATITIGNGNPYNINIVASPSPVTGNTTTLTVTASDDLGEPPLTYSWSKVGSPNPVVVFSASGTNAAKSCIATFSSAEDYTLRVTVADAEGGSATADVVVTVQQTPTGVAVTPLNPTLETNASIQFYAWYTDQFGQYITSGSPTVNSWSINPVEGSINSTGLYTAPSTPTVVTVTANTPSGPADSTVLITLPGGGSNDNDGGGGGSKCGFGAGLSAYLSMLLLGLWMLALRRSERK